MPSNDLLLRSCRATLYHGTKLIVELLDNEQLLAAIKVFCDWLAGNKRLLQMLLPVCHIWLPRSHLY